MTSRGRSFSYRFLFVNQWQRCQEDDVVAQSCIPFCKDCCFACNDTAGLFGQLLQRTQRFAGADYIVYQQNALAAQILPISSPERNSFCKPAVVMDCTSTSTAFFM